jgi:hypothetical protein
MLSGSQGIRWLSIFVGVLGSLGWLWWTWMATDGFDTLNGLRRWLLLAGDTAGCFLIPWALVQSAAWVVQKIQKDREDESP